jgi:hypothetical protein
MTLVLELSDTKVYEPRDTCIKNDPIVKFTAQNNLPHRVATPASGCRYQGVFFFLFITLVLELSDTKVYQPEIRGCLGVMPSKRSDREIYRTE